MLLTWTIRATPAVAAASNGFVDTCRRAADSIRPIAPCARCRCEGLHTTASVQPTSGEATWFLSTGLSKPLFEELLAASAREAGAGRERRIVLALDNAGRHDPNGLAVRAMPAERLWPLVDEPVADRHFATLADLDAAGTTLPPCAHTPASIGGPSRSSRTHQPEAMSHAQMGIADGGRRGQLGAGAGPDRAAPLDDRDPVGQAQHGREVLVDEQDGQALRFQGG